MTKKTIIDLIKDRGLEICTKCAEPLKNGNCVTEGCFFNHERWRAEPTRRCGASLLRSSHPEDTPEEKSITLNIDPSLPDVMTISELDDLPAASYTFSSIEHALDFIEMNSGTLFTQVDSEIDNSVLYRQGNAVCNRTGVYAVVVTDCMRDSMQA